MGGLGLPPGAGDVPELGLVVGDVPGFKLGLGSAGLGDCGRLGLVVPPPASQQGTTTNGHLIMWSQFAGLKLQTYNKSPE